MLLFSCTDHSHRYCTQICVSSCIFPSSVTESLHALQDTVAIKFFIDRQAFYMEKLISSLPSLSGVIMQPNFVSNADEACCAPMGYIFPPHTITETCMSLDSQMVRTTVPKKPVEVLPPVYCGLSCVLVCYCSTTGGAWLLLVLGHSAADSA